MKTQQAGQESNPVRPAVFTAQTALLFDHTHFLPFPSRKPCYINNPARQPVDIHTSPNALHTHSERDEQVTAAHTENPHGES